MVFIEYVSWVQQHFLHPYAFLAIIPLVIALYFMIFRDWVKFTGEDATDPAIRQRQRIRWAVFVLRSLAVILLVCAIASYHTQQEVFVEGEPFLRVIIDNSSSFSMYDRSRAEALTDAMSKVMRVETSYVGDEDSTALGDAVLSSLTENGNTIVVSDGQSNKGADLGDVALYAARLNATLSALTLEPQANDVRVRIKGPSKTLSDIENAFVVQLDRTGESDPVPLTVKVDGQVVYEQMTRESTVTIPQTFQDGYHRIEARVDHEDFFPQNNQYYKAVKVVPKPEIAYITTQDSPLASLLSQVYKVDEFASVPTDLGPYHAIVVNNLNTKDLTEDEVERLSTYVSDGNGLFVVGGLNSFERGAYKDSTFEQLLPVYVAEAGKEEGDINVVLVIDISGSTGTAIAPGQKEAIHVNKAQAISVFKDLRPENRLGIVAFNAQSFVIEPMGYIFEKVGLVDRIAKIKAGGGTLISSGLMKGVEMLKATEGSKNLILISDGKTQLASKSFETAKLAEKLGIKIYTVGVGARRNDFVLQKIAEITNGIFFPADQSSKLKILFGDVDAGDKQRFGVTVLDENHFITDGLDVAAMVSGYNPVVPKSTANLLLTTDVGDPLLTVWRYGLGRIGALTTDDGSKFAGELLNRRNSVLHTRTLNWVIGDPDRKNERFVDIPDTRVGAPTKVLVRAPSPPKAEGVVFFKTESNRYSATIVPEQRGFQQVMQAVFAVNYKQEFGQLGESPRLREMVEGTGGEFYDPDEMEEIIDAVKSRSKRAVVKKVFIRWPFIVSAMVIFLLDVLARRLMKAKRFKAG